MQCCLVMNYLLLSVTSRDKMQVCVDVLPMTKPYIIGITHAYIRFHLQPMACKPGVAGSISGFSHSVG